MSSRGVVDRAGIDEAGLTAIARALAAFVREGGVVHLVGSLGAGKTTFARALLGALGAAARVKSPTYSLIESYDIGDLTAHHLDLYRIAAPDELEWLGLRDLASGTPLWLIEWPERAVGAVPAPDLTVELRHAARGRDMHLIAHTERARNWLEMLNGIDLRQGVTRTS